MFTYHICFIFITKNMIGCQCGPNVTYKSYEKPAGNLADATPLVSAIFVYIGKNPSTKVAHI